MTNYPIPEFGLAGTMPLLQISKVALIFSLYKARLRFDAMLKKDEALHLQRICEGFAYPLEFTFYQTQITEFSRKLESFVHEICRLSQGKIRAISGGPDPGSPACPCFKIGFEGRSCITYAALPTGHQFNPFARALELVAGNHSRVPGDALTAGSPQAELQVFISENCPRCPAAVETAILLSSQCSSIFSSIVDAGQFSNLIQQYGIKSVPATILDRRLVLIGNVSADRLMELVEIRGTLKFEMEMVRSLIHTGRIVEAANCIVQDAGREVVLELLQDADFSKRLGAMVVIEKALENKPDAVRSMVPSLVKMLSHSDSRIRGDIADLLGKIGDPRAIPQIEHLLTDADPDVVEAAAEAIEELSAIGPDQADG